MQFIYDEHYTVLHKGFAKRCVIKLSLWDKNEFQTNVWKRKRTKIKGKENFSFSVKSFEEILLPAPACYFKRY